MKEHNFDKILDFLCSGIAMKSERERVRDELYDHLMCKYETNIACGMEEEKAVEAAIKDLGDAEKLKSDLGAVHGYAPKTAMKKALEGLRFSYLFALMCGAFKAMNRNEIWGLIGPAYFLLGVFGISKANKKLKRAFYINSISYVLICLLNGFMSDWFELFNFNIPFGIVNFVLNVLFSACFTGGLYELVKPYESIKPMKNKLRVVFVLNIILSVVQFILFTTHYGDNNYEILKIPLAVAILCANVVNFTLWNMSKLLFDSDHEYKVEASVSKSFSVLIIALIVGVLPAVCIDVAYSLQKAETSAYTIDDSDISQSEYNRICNNLLSYGIPEEIVYNLPESEIEKYGDSLNLSEIDNSAKSYYLRREETELKNFNGVLVETNTWAVVLKNGNIRVLSYLKYVEGSKGFIDGAFLESSLTTSQEKDESSFVLVLSEENGVTVKNEPIGVYDIINGANNTSNGVIFEAKNGLTVICAQTFTDNEPQRYNYILSLYVRKTPFALFYRNPYDAFLYTDSYDYYKGKRKVIEYDINQELVGFRSGEPANITEN